MIRGLLLSAAALFCMAAICGPASAATVTVQSYANSSTGGIGLDTGLDLLAGDLFQVWANIHDTWSLGDSNPFSRETNADGLSLYHLYAQGGLTARFGTLVGQIGSGDFFVIGTHFTGPAGATGRLYLWNFDSNQSDNSGEITARVSAQISSQIPAQISAVPLPAGGPLLLGVLAGLAALRRRKPR